MLTISDTFPYVDPTSVGIPRSTLTMNEPVYVGLPYSGRVADDYVGHVGLRTRGALN
jgi:hypothetical protein